MPLRYQKRINLGKGLGINVSSSGISSSYRTKLGSIGSRGFSIKTGIPGLSFRNTWGKGSTGFVIALVYIAVIFFVLVSYNLIRLVFFLVKRFVVAIVSITRKRHIVQENKSNPLEGELGNWEK